MKVAEYKTGQMLVQLGNLVTWFRNQKLQRQNLTSGQAGIIGCLRKQNDLGITTGKLAKELNCSKPTVSEMLNTLERKSLIRRCEDENDCRKNQIFLTTQGKEKETYLREVSLENEQILLRGMSAAEQKEFNRLLQIALENMKEMKLQNDR